jgi:hypothetical protein
MGLDYVNHSNCQDQVGRLHLAALQQQCCPPRHRCRAAGQVDPWGHPVHLIVDKDAHFHLWVQERVEE